jgi:hypothetical protein
MFPSGAVSAGSGSASMVQGWGRTSTEVLPVFNGTDRYGRAGSLALVREVFWVSAGSFQRGCFWDKSFPEYHFQTPLGIPSC